MLDMLAPLLQPTEPREVYGYDLLRDVFLAALADPQATYALPLPSGGHVSSMSLADWWASNVVDNDLAEVIGIVRDAARAGDQRAAALINRLAHTYARDWSEE